MNYREQFINAYTAALYFTDTGEDGQPPASAELSPEARERIHQDCGRFIALAGEVEPAEQAGHDFWLTRNGHGVGFWDSPELYGGQETADDLSVKARSFGEVWTEHGDDGLIHLTGGVLCPHAFEPYRSGLSGFGYHGQPFDSAQRKCRLCGEVQP